MYVGVGVDANWARTQWRGHKHANGPIHNLFIRMDHVEGERDNELIARVRQKLEMHTDIKGIWTEMCDATRFGASRDKSFWPKLRGVADDCKSMIIVDEVRLHALLIDRLPLHLFAW